MPPITVGIAAAAVGTIVKVNVGVIVDVVVAETTGDCVAVPVIVDVVVAETTGDCVAVPIIVLVIVLVAVLVPGVPGVTVVG
jgi:hypothetical protein